MIEAAIARWLKGAATVGASGPMTGSDIIMIMMIIMMTTTHLRVDVVGDRDFGLDAVGAAV